MAEHRICSVEGCEKPYLSKGLCNAHYIRQRKHGSPSGGAYPTNNSGPCSVESCETKAWSLGYCRKHYNRLKRNGDPLAGIAFHGEQAAFLRHAASATAETCILWPFAIASNGYGVTGSGPSRGAHRAACIIAHGSPPSPDHEAAHSCNVRSCVNGKHLRWATVEENMADKIGHDTHLRGERNHQAKLTEADVLAIRTMEGRFILREVSERYGVSICTVHRIWRGEAWTWLKEASPAP
jgi:hypothetical protein